MRELPDTLTIRDKAFAHRYDADKGVHIFENGSNCYHFKAWNFAQKGAAINASIVLDQATGDLRIDTARFNESMLLASLVKAQVDGKALEVSLNELQELPVSLGDELLGFAQLVNELMVGEERVAGAMVEKFEQDLQSGTLRMKIGEDEYLLKEWTWGKKNEVTSQSLTYDTATDQMRVNLATFNELMLMTTIVEAPFDITLANIQSLPAPEGDALLREAQQINGVTATEKKRS